MIDAAYCRAMTHYNRWMNARLYAICADLTPAERTRDRGAFFGSIHDTLDHLLYGDLAMLSRLTGDPAEMPLLGVRLHAAFDELRAEREALDARLVAWAEGVSDAWLREIHRFTSQTDGQTRSLPSWLLVVHLFNHQTHHRGQLTTLLSQLDLDPGHTDLHKLPGLAELVQNGA